MTMLEETVNTIRELDDDDDDGLSMDVSTILFIIFVILLALYCLGGAVYKRTRLGVTGWEAIPNVEIWREIPMHIKNAWEYCSSKVRQRFFGTGYQPLS